LRSDSAAPGANPVTTYAAMFAKVDLNRTDSYAQNAKLGVEYNTFYGNYYHAVESALSLGSNALHKLGGGSLTLFGDTLFISSSEGASATIAFPQYGTFRYSSTGTHLIDYTFLGYADETGISYGIINTDDNGLGKDLRLDREIEIIVKNDQGQNVENALVTVTNNYNRVSASGYTNISGVYIDTATYMAFKYNSPNSSNSWNDSLAYNDYEIVAKSGSDSVVSIITINPQTVFPITLNINGAGSTNTTPSAPSALSPANGAAINDLNPVLIINNSNDIDGDNLTYNYQVSSNISFSAIVINMPAYPESGGSTTAWSASPALSDSATYYWRARAYDGQVYSNWSDVRSFSILIQNTAPHAPVLASPADADDVSELQPLLILSNSYDAEGDNLTYSIEVSSNSDFTALDAITSGLVEGIGSTTEWQVSSPLTVEQTYYWRARCNDGTDNSNWSTVRSFNIVDPNSPPSVPVLVTPANDSEVNSLRPDLTINNSTDNDGDSLTYDFQVSTNQIFTTLAAEVSNFIEGQSATTIWTVSSDLSDGQTYYWRVRTYDGEEYSDWSTVRNFAVNIPNTIPTVPTLYAPLNAATLQSITPILTVYNSIDADGDAISYHFQVSANSSFTAIIAQITSLDKSDGDTTSWQVDSILDHGQTYAWRTRSYDGTDSADWMGWSDFQVQQAAPTNTAPSVPVVHSPADNEVLLGQNHNLIVYNSSDNEDDILTYEYKICSDSAMTLVMEQNANITEGSGDTTLYQTTATNQDGERYCWQVRAYDGELCSDWIMLHSFVHYSMSVNAEDIPIPEAPLDGEIVNNVRPRFEISVDETGVGINFYFEVANNADFTNSISSGPVVGKRPSTIWTPEQNLIADEGYFWRVKSETSGWSETIYFHVKGDTHLSPNPFRARKHDEIVFRNLPQNSSIQIITISGDIVNEFIGINDIEYSWNVTNSQGQPLANGVYLYYISSDNRIASGKFAVLK